MRLWLLLRTDKYEYDVYDGFVVRAETEAEARVIAAKDRTDNLHNELWAPDEFVTCEQILEDGEAGVIMSSYRGG